MKQHLSAQSVNRPWKELIELPSRLIMIDNNNNTYLYRHKVVNSEAVAEEIRSRQSLSCHYEPNETGEF